MEEAPGIPTEGKGLEAAYSYTPLQSGEHTRILRLHPALRPEEPLRCDLVHFQHGDGEYEAISYAWGQPSNDDPPVLFLRTDLRSGDSPSQEHFTILNITPSLDGALRALRSEGETRDLWADAVCINQRDDEEKARQVQGMSEIYSKAKAVQIWLGGGYEEGEKAIRFMSNMKTADQPIPGNILPAARNLFLRSWFQRRWIIQEVVLAEVAYVHCGSASMNFAQFARRSKTVRASLTNTSSVEESSYELLQSLHLFHEQNNFWKANNSDGHDGWRYAYRFPIYPFLHNFHPAQCQDDRDRVYALLGLCDDIIPLTAPLINITNPRTPLAKAQLSISYKAEIEDVYTDLTLALWKVSTDLLPPCQSLHYSGTFRGSDVPGSRLPSWVPDWRAPKRFSQFAHKRYSNEDVLTWKTPSYQPELTANGKGLLLYGWYVDAIREKGTGLQDNMSVTTPLEALRRTLHHWHAPFLGGFEDLSTRSGKDVIELFIRSFVGMDKLQWVPWALDFAYRLHQLSFNELQYSDDEIRKDLFARNFPPDIMRNCINRYIDLMKGRSSFRGTKDRMVFNCPQDTEAGDVVFILDSEDTPFVLRPLDPDDFEAGWRLIGDVGTLWSLEKQTAMVARGERRRILLL